MHELYLAEKIIDEIEKKAQKNGARKVLEVNIAIPEDEHFTESEFEKILKMQAEDTKTHDAKIMVTKEKTDKVYIKDIKIIRN